MDRREQLPEINIPTNPTEQINGGTLLQVTYQQSVTLYHLVQESNSLRTQLSELNESFKELVSELTSSAKKINISRTLIGEPDLLRILNPSESDYDLSIQTYSGFSEILSKGKIFVLSLQVISISEIIISDDFSVKVSVKIYSSENPPRPIYANKQGQPLIQTDPFQTIISYNPRRGSHTGVLKARINEVTSHYPNGWVFVVVEAAPSEECVGNIRVKPLIIKNVVVRAKKPINKIQN